MGKHIATSFLQQGANVVINSRNQDKLEALANSFPDHQSQIKIVSGDVAVKSTGKALTDAAIQTFGNIDVLINNAGVFTPKPFLDATEDELDMYQEQIDSGNSK